MDKLNIILEYGRVIAVDTFEEFLMSDSQDYTRYIIMRTAAIYPSISDDDKRAVNAVAEAMMQFLNDTKVY